MSVFSDAGAVVSAIKPGDTVTVQGTLIEVRRDEVLVRLARVGGYEDRRVHRDAIVTHTPKPAPQCRSLLAPFGWVPHRYVQCVNVEGHDDHHADSGALRTWTAAEEYGRVTPRGEQP